VVLRLPLSASKPIVDSLTLHGIVVYGKAHHAVEMAIPLPRNFVPPFPRKAELHHWRSWTGTFTTQDGGTGTHSLLLYILSALLGGLILNIMPCVLPVIALKVFGLVKMAGDDPARIKRLGWTFASGILASFLVLAAIVILLQAADNRLGGDSSFRSRCLSLPWRVWCRVRTEPFRRLRDPPAKCGSQRHRQCSDTPQR